MHMPCQGFSMDLVAFLLLPLDKHPWLVWIAYTIIFFYDASYTLIWLNHYGLNGMFFQSSCRPFGRVEWDCRWNAIFVHLARFLKELIENQITRRLANSFPSFVSFNIDMCGYTLSVHLFVWRLLNFLCTLIWLHVILLNVSTKAMPSGACFAWFD
jgi:hypothetical protein